MGVTINKKSQTVLGSDSVPGFVLKKMILKKKKSADDKKIMKYYPACKELFLCHKRKHIKFEIL